MQHYFLSLVLICSAIFNAVEAGEASRNEYLELVKQYPKVFQPQGDFAKGEIQIVLDPQEMANIEKTAARDVGIMKQDKYWLWINDACIFPNGKKGVYGRILWAKSLESCPGVAVMPVLPDGKIVLNCNFRHATRSWEMELPRGGLNAGEDIIAAAKRETMEETGMLVDELILLGEMPPDSGLTNTIVPIFVAKVIEKQSSQPEDSEAIEEIISLTIPEIKQAFLKGYYEHTIRGVSKKIHFRDPFLAYAILIYELKSNE